MNNTQLSRNYLETVTDEERQSLLKEISSTLSERILKTSNFDQEIEDVVKEFRALGHDLWLYDSNGEWELYCGDYTKPEVF